MLLYMNRVIKGQFYNGIIGKSSYNSFENLMVNNESFV